MWCNNAVNWSSLCCSALRRTPYKPNDANSRPCVRSAAAFTVFLLVNALCHYLHRLRQVDISLCSSASQVLWCCPTSPLWETLWVKRTALHLLWLTPHLRSVFVFFACIEWERSSMHREVFSTWIPPFQLISAGFLSDLLILACEVSTHARFSDSAGSFSNSHITLPFAWPSPSVHRVGTRKKVISELNGLPTLPPVNKTSPKPIRYRTRRMTQNRRLLWFAKSST
jgi:hypothetical protein